MTPQRTAGAEQHNAAARGDGPAPRTPQAAAAAAQQQQRAAADMAWPLLLQHDSIRTQLPVACKLLCCSQSLAAAVAEHSAGQLDIPKLATAEQAEQAAAWLRKHGQLVRSLNLVFMGVRLMSPAAVNDCVAALVAAGPQSLALQSLQLQATNTTLPLLEQLPASCLTRLVLLQPSELPPDDRASMTRVSAALGRLPALRSLELIRRDQYAAPPYELSGLSALTQLTAFEIDGPLSDLQHAPPQLLELQLTTLYVNGEPPPLDLRHLAAAMALSILQGREPVREGDVLPPNLLRLQVDEWRSVRPLLPLVQLQDLTVALGAPPDITADQLRQLSRLTALSLDYKQHTAAPASAGAWPPLPLQRLELKSVTLSAPVCQHLAQLSGLTSLALRVFELPQPGSVQQLAAALMRLSGLQQLELSKPLPAVAGATATQEQQEEAAAGMGQLVQAVGSLQRLRELDISCFPQLAAAAGGNSSSLAALTALTRLSLFGCGVTDAAVAAIVSQLPGLQSLDCSLNPQLTDAALPAIGRLQQLTKLSLLGTRVSDAGLQHLAGLTRLKRLDVRYTRVTDAGVCQLTGLTGLQQLGVPSEVTKQRRKWLKQQLPHLLTRL